MVLYAVGDIHGCADLLLELRRKISADAAKRSGPKKLIFLGDYVDRGPHSADVIDVLMSGPPEGIDEQICLRGNHEQMMLDWHGQRDWLGSWLLNGGGQTRRLAGPVGDVGRKCRRLNGQTVKARAQINFGDRRARFVSIPEASYGRAAV